MKENKKVQHNLDLSGKTIVNARLVNCRAEGGFASKLELMSTLLERIKTLDDYLGIDSGKIDPALEKYFTIEATQNGTKVYFRQSSYAVDDGLDPLTVEVSTDDGNTWASLTASPADGDNPVAVIPLDEGERALIRGKNEAYGYYSESEGDYIDNCNFYADKPCYVYGNIMSLVGGNDFSRLRKVSDCAFAFFFSDYNGVIDASWVLSKDGESLSLPATTLAENCYRSMFYNCTSLVQAPELPATTLAPYCYEFMFGSCTSLNYIKALFTTTPSDNYTYGWVSGVNANGTFVKNSHATWNVTGNNGIPSGWTVENADA